MLARAKTRYGSQDPTRKVYLNRERGASYGTDAIATYEKTGRKAQPWQVNLMTAILSYDEDGIYIYSEFGYSVPRRNGKNEVVSMRELYGLTQLGEKIIHTAHRVNTSSSAFERLYGLLCDAGYVEGQDFKAARQKGLEKLSFYETGGEVHFRTRSAKGGLGEGFDLLVIDEAQEATDDHIAALGYVVSDSKNPQKIYLGTPPTPQSSGTVFVKMREETLAGKRKYTGWAEWSVEELSDPRNIDLWYLCNPAMGYQLNERKVEVEYKGDDLDFNIQRLGYWVQYNLQSAITETEWDALKVDALPQFKGKLHAGIKFGHDGTNAAMSIAVMTQDDKVFVETIDCKNMRLGISWITEYLSRIDRGTVVVDGANGQALLDGEVRRAKLKPYPILPTVKEVIAASTAFEQCMQSGKLCHSGQPSLKESATNCEKRPIGANGGFGYKSIQDGIDVAILESVVLATWACLEAAKEKPKARIW